MRPLQETPMCTFQICFRSEGTIRNQHHDVLSETIVCCARWVARLDRIHIARLDCGTRADLVKIGFFSSVTDVQKLADTLPNTMCTRLASSTHCRIYTFVRRQIHTVRQHVELTTSEATCLQDTTLPDRWLVCTACVCAVCLSSCRSRRKRFAHLHSCLVAPDDC